MRFLLVPTGEGADRRPREATAVDDSIAGRLVIFLILKTGWIEGGSYRVGLLSAEDHHSVRLRDLAEGIKIGAVLRMLIRTGIITPNITGSSAVSPSDGSPQCDVCLLWTSGGGAVSLAGAATSIIFVATKHVFCGDKSVLVATKVFVTTNII